MESRNMSNPGMRSFGAATAMAMIAFTFACTDSETAKTPVDSDRQGTETDSLGGSIDSETVLDTLAEGDGETETDTETDTDTDTDTETASPPNDADFYALDHVIEINIETSPEDWELLRYEGRGTASVVAYCQDVYDYTYIDAEVTIDGEPVENARVRKKGFFGSLSALRPSLKLKFDAPEGIPMLSGIKGLTLNNDRQDPSHTHQVMSYALFSEAGIAAPRCNFARVTVNGEDLGIYSNVEPIKKPFLARHFGDDGGNLYEAQGADFSPELAVIYQPKSGDAEEGADEGEADLSDVFAVVDALDVEDSRLEGALEKVLNLDGFYTFWAMEVILGHWDSYSGNRNNYYIYHDPISGLFNFIPWGTDGAFESTNFSFPDAPVSVYAFAVLANRLYNYEETRERYQARLESLLSDLWDEEALLSEVDQIEQLTSADSAAVQKQRSFIKGRRQLLLDDIQKADPEWPYPYESIPRECGVVTDISGDFKAVLDTGQNFAAVEDISLTLGWEKGPEVLTDLSTSATIGIPFGGGTEESFQLTMTAPRENGNTLMLSISIPLAAYAEGEVPFHGLENSGMLFEIGEQFAILGYVGDGSVSFDEISVETGGTVSGSFVGKFAQLIR